MGLRGAPIVASKAVISCLVGCVLVAACAAHPQALLAKPGQRDSHVLPKAGPSESRTAGITIAAGTAGTFQVGEQELTLAEPAHEGSAGQYLTQRMLVIDIRYPRAQQSGAVRPASGPFPLIMFAPGFMQCDSPYSDLLDAWASAGYVVAAVNFPRTDCRVGTAAYEPDLVNQPGDMSYALSELLKLTAHPGSLLSGLLNSRQVGAAGQSDGGDTVAALAANACCADHRLAAAAVLSGAEWPPMPGPYFADGAPPMLFVQGSADTINPPWTSVQLYSADKERARYYLDLFGATHTVPYWGTNQVEQIVARVTLAFFDRYLLGAASALQTMTRAGNVSGAALVTAGQPPP
jgi:dienelactone hydrolase